jgi:hypothetical protein
MTYDFSNDNDIDYSDNDIGDDDDKIQDNEEGQDENETQRLGTAYVKKKHGSMIDHETGTANPLDADVLPEPESKEEEVELRRGKKAEDDEERESKLPRAVAPTTAKQQFKEKLKAAQAAFGKLPPPPKAANDNFRPVVSWPLMDQLTRKTFEPDAERRTKNIVTARYLRELIDTAEADSLGLSVHLPGKSASGDHDMQRTESGKVFFEHGQTLDRRKVIYDEKNGEADAERYSGSPRTATKSLPVGNSGFNLPFPVRVMAAREELDAIIAAVGPMLWPYLLMAISYNATMTDIGLALGVKRYQAAREGTAIIRRGLAAAMEAMARLNGVKDEPRLTTPMPEKSRGSFYNKTRNHVMKVAA